MSGIEDFKICPNNFLKSTNMFYNVSPSTTNLVEKSFPLSLAKGLSVLLKTKQNKTKTSSLFFFLSFVDLFVCFDICSLFLLH